MKIFVGAGLWMLSAGVLFAFDRETALTQALPAAAYAAVLFGLTAWLIPKAARDDEDVLRAVGTRRSLILRCAVIAGALLWLIGMNVLVPGGVHVPVLSQWAAVLPHIRLFPSVGGFTLENFLAEALVPGILLLALGATAKQLGLTRPARGTWKAMLACMIVPAVIIGMAVVRGRLSVSVFFWRLIVHNLFSNGFSEEFIMRGAVLSHLRAFLKSDWALLVQGALFALPHYGITEEHGRPALIVAEVFALNFPIGITLGFMALRSRSLLLPTVVHVSLDAMKDVVAG